MAMKVQLGFSDDVSILKYIKVKAINGFNQKNLIVGINPTAPKKWNVKAFSEKIHKNLHSFFTS